VGRNDDWDGSDLDETVRNLRVLADAPGDLRFRQNIAASFEKVTDRLSKIDTKLARIEERLIPRTEVAAIAQKEMQVLENKVETLSKLVYTLCGIIATTLVAIIFAKIFR
jgi:predicted nuclease with TOPRIM domain